MLRIPHRVVAAGLAVLLLSGCPASDEGTALLRNETGKTGLTVAVVAPDGHVLEEGRLQETYRFDVQWTDRERQCYVSSDGALEVRSRDGSVLTHHDFSERDLCELEEITVAPDGTLTWLD